MIGKTIRKELIYIQETEEIKTSGVGLVEDHKATKTVHLIIIIIIIIIIINCNWVVTRWQWLFYMHTKYEIGYY